MRNELENIEIIEKYLRDELSASDKKAFEEKLKTDANLQKEVELQREVVEGIKRMGVKQSIQKAYKKYKLGKSGLNFGLGTIIIIGLVSAFFWYSNTNSVSANQLPELNENGEAIWADADKYLESQKFTINTAKDTVIESEGGIVMYIPAGSFLDENGNEVTGEVEYELKEALSADEIIQAGLSSKSGDNLLESAGMFYVNARQNGKSLKINPDKGIYTEVPSDEVNPDMQLFEGKRMTDGSIDWVDPKPLDKFLTPVDIHSLNFYPPNYEPKLAELGRDASDENKAYKDSLYYSFSWLDKSTHQEIEKGEELFNKTCISCHSIGKGRVIGSDLYKVYERHSKEWLSKAIKNYGALVKSGDKEAIRIYNEYGKMVMPPQPIGDDDMDDLLAYIKYMSEIKDAERDAEIMIEKMFSDLEENPTVELMVDSIATEEEFYHDESPEEPMPKGINPAKIKAVWSNEFKNTLIATREFEERLKTIFGTCNDAILDLYVNNLNLNLYEIDEKAASMTSGEIRAKFLAFASRKDGKVDIDDKRAQQLQKHYKRKQKLIAEAVAKTKRKFDEEQKQLTNKVQEERTQHYKDEVKRKSDNFVEEFNVNLRDAYRQLGMKKPKRYDAEGIYRLTLKTGGWKNVDAYVMESVANRETMDYTEPITGKKAVIKYEPISVSIANESSYDRVLVYLLPDKLNSFMRMKKEGSKYTEKLNELMSNRLICLAYKGEQAYFYSNYKVQPKDYGNIQLEPISQKELKQQLYRTNKKQRKNMLKELEYQLMEVEESKRQEYLANRRKFRKEIERAIFPCDWMNVEVVEEVVAEDSEIEVVRAE